MYKWFYYILLFLIRGKSCLSPFYYRELYTIRFYYIIAYSYIHYRVFVKICNQINFFFVLKFFGYYVYLYFYLVNTNWANNKNNSLVKVVTEL